MFRKIRQYKNLILTMAETLKVLCKCVAAYEQTHGSMQSRHSLDKCRQALSECSEFLIEE